MHMVGIACVVGGKEVVYVLLLMRIREYIIEEWEILKF